ncbi:MAG: FG-GAP and VCBS repeat-containing protein [Polyangiales bacterium]
MSVACVCLGGLTGVQTCTSEGVYGVCVCPDASAPTDAASDAWTLDIPVRPLGPRLITPQSISRTTTQRPTFRWVLPDGVTRARVTVARDRALTMDVRTGMATGTSWRPTEPLPFAVWFWRVEGLGEDGGVVWTSPTWEFRAPRRDTAVDSSWGTWRDFNGDGYDDLVVLDTGLRPEQVYWGSMRGVSATGTNIDLRSMLSRDYGWSPNRPQFCDFNGDGLADLAVEVYGLIRVDIDAGSTTPHLSSAVVVYYGRPSGFADTPDLIFREPNEIGAIQLVGLTTGDFDGDGFGDALIGEVCGSSGCDAVRDTLRIRLYSGSSTGLESVSRLQLAEGEIQPFSALQGSSRADLNLDGLPEFQFRTSIGLLVVSSLAGGVASVSTVPAGGEPLFGADFDGDGYGEWLHASPDSITFFRWTSTGPAPNGWSALRSPDIPSGIAGRSFGMRITAGDVNGDGYADLITSAPEAPLPAGAGLRGDGRVYLYPGGVRGPGVLAVRWDARPTGIGGIEDNYGAYIASCSDYDGDGFDDVIVTGLNRVEVKYGAARAEDAGSRTTELRTFSDRPGISD